MNLQRCFISDGPSQLFSVARNVRFGSKADIITVLRYVRPSIRGVGRARAK